MGGGRVAPEVEALAGELGRAIALEGWVVLSGGRDSGVMAAVSAGAAQAGGLVVGVLPDNDLSRATTHLTIPIRTGLGDGRNIINILSSDVVVALPGGAGTLSEIALAVKNHKPLYLLGWTAPPVRLFDDDSIRCFTQVTELLIEVKNFLEASDSL